MIRWWRCWHPDPRLIKFQYFPPTHQPTNPPTHQNLPPNPLPIIPFSILESSAKSACQKRLSNKIYSKPSAMAKCCRKVSQGQDGVKHFGAVIIHPVRPFTKFTNSVGKYFTWLDQRATAPSKSFPRLYYSQKYPFLLFKRAGDIFNQEFIITFGTFFPFIIFINFPME